MVNIMSYRFIAFILSFTSAAVFGNENKQGTTSISSKEVIRIEATIVGSKEQPKFLTIVPWRSLKSPAINKEKTRQLITKKLTLIEPNELKAQLGYK